MTKEQIDETVKLLAAEIAKIPAHKAKPTIKGHWRGETKVGLELWSNNPRAGNMTLHVIDTYAPEMVPVHVRKVQGAATKRDQAAFARMAAEKQVNAE